jgi:hypothetical protein
MKFYTCKITHKKTPDKIACKLFFNNLPEVVYSLANLLIYFHFEPKRIGSIVIAVGSPSSSNYDRAISEDTPQNTLHYLNTLAFRQYQFNCPPTDYPCLDNHTPVSNGID